MALFVLLIVDIMFFGTGMGFWEKFTGCSCLSHTDLGQIVGNCLNRSFDIRVLSLLRWIDK